jgi:peptidoglycan/xylan/chitin deacetylase (PgdA/CDA1 family)
MAGILSKIFSRSAGQADSYRRAWRIGTIVCYLLYFSGVYWIHLLFDELLRRRQRRVVLTYHRVRDDSLDPHISVTPETFERQLRYLKSRFMLTSLDALLSAAGQAGNGRKPIVAMTFDDGYLDNFEHAFPLLRKYRVPATIFLVSRWVGKPMFLDTHHLLEMLEHGIEFGSHTQSHPVLTSIALCQAKNEIKASKREIEHILQRAVRFFAYPKGKSQDVGPDIVRAVEDAGYEAAFMAENGTIRGDEGRFELKRIGIRECSMIVFKLRLSGLLETRLVFGVRQAFGLT